MEFNLAQALHEDALKSRASKRQKMSIPEKPAEPPMTCSSAFVLEGFEIKAVNNVTFDNATFQPVRRIEDLPGIKFQGRFADGLLSRTESKKGATTPPATLKQTDVATFFIPASSGGVQPQAAKSAAQPRSQPRRVRG